MSDEEFVSRNAMASTLGVTVTTIANLRSQYADFPVRVRGRSVTFPRDRCVQWYIKFKQQEVRRRSGAETPEEVKEIDRRTKLADMQIREAEAAAKLGQLTTVPAFEQAMTEYAARVRAVHNSAPSRYARKYFPDLPFADALKRLQKIFDAVERNLQADEDDALDEVAA